MGNDDQRRGWAPTHLPIPSLTETATPLACVQVNGDAALPQLLAACAALTPRIERHSDQLVLDLTGCERLLLGREGMPTKSQHATMDEAAHWPLLAERLHAHLVGSSGRSATLQDSTVRVALAPTRTVAWLAVSLSGRPVCAVPPAEVEALLRPLSVRMLLTLPDVASQPAATSAVTALAESGVATVGQLARLAPLALQRRFGPLGAALALLAEGRDLTPFRIAPPEVWLGARLRLDPPARLASLADTLHPLAAFLARALGQRRLEAGEVALVVRAEDRLPWRVTHRLGHATASRAALLVHAQRLLRQTCADHGFADGGDEGDGVESAPVSSVALRVGALRPERPHQRAIWPPLTQRARDPAWVARRLVGDHTAVGRRGCPWLWHAVVEAPDAVLPEERYTLRALHAS